MDITRLHESRTLRYSIYAVGALFILLLVFRAGVAVGFRESSFAHRSLTARDRDPRPFFSDDFPQTHGGVGKITAVQLPSLTIETPEGVQKIVLLTASTSIRMASGTSSPGSLSIGKYIIVLGMPDQNGTIEARALRELPPPPDTF